MALLTVLLTVPWTA
jgi:hypothetical protein